ncbi:MULTISPECIES: hypothetical protein [Gammaproteobacteria]|uniref:hypothetical protein n=1 Tax=Gammaproteobacteria TaxID=1236 RepID=UPI000260F6E4|nr:MULTISPECIES: hypothetical protein [Rhodanobacter]EIM04446.1 hypothetical protein UUC_02471 [Rhodanobacter denitrificans]KZC21189.1 hypothetical protein RHOFW104R3_21735 [Rhodanobacter denitrificans]UJJ49905.1 hypothetical protein LRK52_11760 [Rhodanobacter denitrificans]UJJ57903.1 hypothetical protein LRK55_14680 [Rhodanobacter denitrificans]UJM91777.1 hypothetical protein LRK24_07600 [Rhodanobacter denitrificans]
MGFFILLIVVVVIIVVVKKGKGWRDSMPAPPGFNPTFQYKNIIAIDVNQEVLMAKDALSGRVTYTKKADILRWNSVTGGGGTDQAALQIHVRDLHNPMIHVSFGSFSPKQGEIQRQWASRLSTWVNNS